MASRTAFLISLGGLLGAGAAALTAMADFGAHWLYLDGFRERAWFFGLLLALQTPLGACLGAGAGLVIATTEPALRACARRLAPARHSEALDLLRSLRWLLLSSPALVAVAVLLFGGARASQLPLLSLWRTAAAVALLGGALAVLYAAHRALARVAGRPRHALALCALALLATGALGKLDQWFLPKLYEYLHAALTGCAFLLGLFGLLCAWKAFDRPRLRPRLALVGAATLGLCIAAFSGALSHLDTSQNVRVALLHPHASHSRSVMQLLTPLVLLDRDRAAVTRKRRAGAPSSAQRVRGTAAGPGTADAHVLLVTIDALRADHLGLYGYRRPTSPELDRLAAQAVVFERAYAPAPHSSYSLCSLMTSQYLHQTVELGQPLPDHTLARVFAQAGYHTAAFYTKGIFHTGGEHLIKYADDDFGFALADHQDRAAEQTTDRVLEEVDRTVARGEPNSFLWVHYFDVHEPYRATELGDSDMDRYDSEIRAVDRALARLVRETRRRLSRPVIVALTSDHGEEFREHGGVYHGSTLYEEQIRVPLLIDAPGLAPARVSATVETVDLAPTLLGLADLLPPASMRGDDLRPLARGELQSIGPSFAAVSHKKMVVRWPHKLVADLRFGLFELYDLEGDPRERNNLADEQPALVDALTDEVHAWLDTVATQAEKDHAITALDWGRLRDRRAVEPLSALVRSEAVPTAQRVEAARILGDLSDKRAAAGLFAALRSAEAEVAAEAAVALGRLYDARARVSLRKLVQSTDTDLRTRAAVSLGRLRDRAAVPGLIEALRLAESQYDRDEAVRWLGRLRDPRALSPLRELLPEMRTRYLVVIAMGLIGDAKAYEPLLEVLSWEHHPNIRDNVARGFGLLGDPRALPAVFALAVEEPSLKNPGETLVRLRAIEAGLIGGTDVARGRRDQHGLGDCFDGDPLHDWNYLHRSYCAMQGARARLRVRVPRAVAESSGGLTAVLSAKRIDAAEAAPLSLRIGDVALPPATLDASWSELRFAIAPGELRAGHATAQLLSEGAARFAIDHLLLLPQSSQQFASAH